MRRTQKMLTVRIEQSLHAQLPEMSRLHSNRSVGEIVRRLLWQEVQRLGLSVPMTGEKAKGRHRYTT